MNQEIRIGVLISGGGTNLQSIINACESKAIHGRVVFVGTDNPSAGGLARAQKHAIANFAVDYRAVIRESRSVSSESALPPDFDLQDCLSKQRFFSKDTSVQRIADFLKSRAVAEAQLLKHIAMHEFDLLALAGFMRNLSPYFIDRINVVKDKPRIMNIHPALLPAFPGTDGYGDTFRYGCKVGGCSVHFVDYGEDSGPIIGQRSFSITPGDTLETVKKKGLEEEWILYPECIRLFAEKRLKLAHKTYLSSDGRSFNRTIVEIL